MKTIKGLIIFLLIIFLYGCHPGSHYKSLQTGEVKNQEQPSMEKISIDAVTKEYVWTKEMQLRARLNVIPRLNGKTYFKNTLLYRVEIMNIIHTPIFIIAIDEKKKNADVFLNYWDAKQFLKMEEGI